MLNNNFVLLVGVFCLSLVKSPWTFASTLTNIYHQWTYILVSNFIESTIAFLKLNVQSQSFGSRINHVDNVRSTHSIVKFGGVVVTSAFKYCNFWNQVPVSIRRWFLIYLNSKENLRIWVEIESRTRFVVQTQFRIRTQFRVKDLILSPRFDSE